MSKIGIISDSHDNLPRIDQMLEILKKENIKIIIHCGDVCTQDSLKYLSQNFKGQIYLSIGNIDVDHEINKGVKNVQIFPQFGEIKIPASPKRKRGEDNINIAFVHFLGKAKKLAQTGKYDFVFYGHTHKPWEEEINSTKIINPGTLAGVWNRSTFAILDTKTKKVKLIIS